MQHYSLHSTSRQSTKYNAMALLYVCVVRFTCFSFCKNQIVYFAIAKDRMYAKQIKTFRMNVFRMKKNKNNAKKGIEICAHDCIAHSIVFTYI